MDPRQPFSNGNHQQNPFENQSITDAENSESEAARTAVEPGSAAMMNQKPQFKDVFKLVVTNFLRSPSLVKGIPEIMDRKFDEALVEIQAKVEEAVRAANPPPPSPFNPEVIDACVDLLFDPTPPKPEVTIYRESTVHPISYNPAAIEQSIAQGSVVIVPPGAPAEVLIEAMRRGWAIVTGPTSNQRPIDLTRSPTSPSVQYDPAAMNRSIKQAMQVASLLLSSFNQCQQQQRSGSSNGSQPPRPSPAPGLD